MDVSPRSLILDLLSTMGRGAMPVRVLVRSGELFGISDNNVRVALARLVRAGRVERDERGRYRLGEAAQAVNRRVVGWRNVEDRIRTWRGGWAGAHTSGLARGDRAGARRNERALRLLGFRTLAPGLAVRPENLTGGVPQLRESLGLLGLDPQAIVMKLGELDAEQDLRARSLWDGAALVAAHREARAAIEESAERLPSLPMPEAMVESFRVGGRALRTIVLDPLLPDTLVPGHERRALVGSMIRYDRMGREAWRSFLGAHGVVQLRAPLDTRQTDRPLAAVAGDPPPAAMEGTR